MKTLCKFLSLGIVASFVAPVLAQDKVVQQTDHGAATKGLWESVDKEPFKLRRSFEDLLEPEFAAAKGAQILYTNDFNAKSEQWGFHGIAGYNWHRSKSTKDASGARRQFDPDSSLGLIEYQIVPSVQWDKIDTSNGDTDEIDALTFRLTAAFLYATDPANKLLDGWRVNLSAAYATDSDFNSGLAAAELDVKPFNDAIGLNSLYREFGIFRLRPELYFHFEGGTVTDEGVIASLAEKNDFVRVGGKVGLSVRFNEKELKALKGLQIQAGLQYYVDLTNNGPDVDLFTASADWALDEKGHFTLSVEYRNGRAPLVLERDNRITVGLGVKF